MANWTAAELDKIVIADDLKVAPFRDDGATSGTPTWIWCVAVEGQLYVRPWNGKASRWYGAAMRQGAGRLVAAGETYAVTYVQAGDEVFDAVDAAYRAKYPGAEYLPDMVGEGPRGATVRINPRDPA
jgi:hypothetical protein